MAPLNFFSYWSLATLNAVASAIVVPNTPPSNAGVPLEAFVSFSIEFSSFPDFAGNKSHPNDFSYNLLKNLGQLQGTKPHIRVGGNTQDFAIFNASLPVASVGVVDPNLSPDYPTTLTIGPSYFQSYQTWPGVKFIHGFNLGRNSSAAKKATYKSASYACKALGENLLYWELGNEPDLFPRSGPRTCRPPNWKEPEFVQEWLNGTREIKKTLAKACPEMATSQRYRYHAPDLAGASGSNGGFRLDTTWKDGLNSDNNVAIVSSHNYISGAASPGVTLQGTLMNHTRTVASINQHLAEKQRLEALPSNVRPNGLPYILGEGNSLYNQGRPGLSNTFGAALWGLDFNLYCAANNISRFHMHTGTDYRYQAWQPIETEKSTKGTKAPYYGNIAVAAFLGNISNSAPRIVNLPLTNDAEAAYAAYTNDCLKRVILINMMGYNTTAENEYTDKYPRPVESYSLQLGKAKAGAVVGLQRLMANGSDAITGATFDGYSYNYELNNGNPVLLRNVTRGQTAKVNKQGDLKVDVPRSSAVILQFDI